MKNSTLVLGGLSAALTLAILMSSDSKAAPIASPQPKAPKPPVPKGKAMSDITSTANVPDTFFDGIADMTDAWRSKGANVAGLDFLKTFNAESGYLDKNLHGDNAYGYGGLNGMGQAALTGVGYTGTKAQYLALDITSQLALARRFLESQVASFCKGDYSKIVDGGRLYLSNIFPAYLGEPAGTVITKKPAAGCVYITDPATGKKKLDLTVSSGYYCPNAGIDNPVKGSITVDDMLPFVTRNWNGRAKAFTDEMIARLQAAYDRRAPTPDAATADTVPPSITPADVAQGGLIAADTDLPDSGNGAT